MKGVYRKIRCVVMSLLALLCVSCGVVGYVPLQDEMHARFVGKTYAEIVDAMGAPDRIMPYDNGLSLVVYEDDEFTGNGYSYGNLISYAYFYMDSNNVCNDVKTNAMKKIYISPKHSVAIVLGTIICIVFVGYLGIASASL